MNAPEIERENSQRDTRAYALRHIPATVRRLFRLPLSRSQLDTELRDEFQFHIDGRVEQLIAQGHSREAAKAQVKLKFGDYNIHWQQTRRIDDITMHQTRRFQLGQCCGMSCNILLAHCCARRHSRSSRSSHWRWELAQPPPFIPWLMQSCCGRCRTGNPMRWCQFYTRPHHRAARTAGGECPRRIF